ncbi:MAG: AAA family ATPase [Alphaproteobacteria bacterium]
MQKIMIIGNSGSGKSTLAKKLSKKLALPVRHLDLDFWSPGWTPPDKPKWRQRLERFLTASDKWVIEGGINNPDLRFKYPDTIIILDIPTWRCLWSVIKRRFFQNPELPKGCPNKLDIALIKYILAYKKRLQALEPFIKQYQDCKQIVRFNSREDATAFVDSLNDSNHAA